MHKADCFLGVDIGGTTCAALIGTGDGSILSRNQWPSKAARGPQLMIDDLTAQAQALQQQQAQPISAVGVSVGGPLDASRGLVLSPPNLPGWDRIELRSILEKRLQLPVRLEHDAAACALAEYEWGTQRTAKRLIYLTCATGFGAGMVFDGEPYYGVLGRSAEIGHILLDPNGPEAFGIKGCAEAFCSARSLGRLASWAFPRRWPQPPDPSSIQGLAAAGDADALQIIDRNARMTGRVCALLLDLLHPDHIALGSLALYLGQAWVEAVRQEAGRLALADAAAHGTIEPARLGTKLQDLSTIAAAKRAVAPSAASRSRHAQAQPR